MKSNDLRVCGGVSDSNNVVRFILDFAGKKETVYLLLVVILTSALDMIGIAAIFPYMQLVADPGRITDVIRWAKPMSLRQQVIGLSVVLVTLYILKGYFQSALIRYQHRQLAFFTAKLTDDTVNRILNASYGLFQEKSGSELAGVAYSNTVHAAIVFRAMIQIGNECCFLSLLCIVFLIISPLATLTVLALLVMVAAVLFLFVIRPTTLLGKKQSNIENERYRLLFSLVNAIRDIKVMGLASLFDAKNREVSAQYAQIAWRYNFNCALPLLLIEIFVLISLVCSVLFVLSTGVSAKELLPAIGVVAVASLRAVPSFARLMMSLNSFRFSRSFVERLIHIRNLLSAHKHVRIEDSLAFERRIELRGIGFRYQEDKPILSNINLEIDRGKFIGIVGVSGSGKTTLLDLITGLQPAFEGQFLCDGQPFDPFMSRSMERIIGYVPQVLTLLDESISYNITFEQEPDPTQLMRVIKIANLEKLISEMPEGIDTKVGENGMNLSGGQRQRVGIARALYRRPEIIVFDEATGALDAQTEQEVTNEIEKLRGEVTMLMVSHRLPAVVHCDRIYVIAHGSVEDSGTHSELLGRCELYRDLYALQTTFA